MYMNICAFLISWLTTDNKQHKSKGVKGVFVARNKRSILCKYGRGVCLIFHIL